MNKNVFSGKLTVKKFCILSLFTAITAILSIYCTLRVGTTIKIPFKFISVFLTAVTLGPLWGASVAALGDILNVFLAPSGAWLPPITVVEFLYGLVFGLFFYKREFSGKSYVLRAVLCTLTLFLIDIFITSYILKSFGYFPNFTVALISRLPAGIIKAAIQCVFIIISQSYLGRFKKVLEN